MLSKKEIYRIIRFATAGVINTITGFGTIFVLMYHGVSPVVSNILGYIVGITLSFFLNSLYTFNSRPNILRQMPKFLLSVFVSYLLNFLCLVFFIYTLKVDKYISQIFAGAVYTVSGYVLMRNFVFRADR